jgi:hypothetical protein
MKKIKLTLLDRLMIPGVLKKEGNYSQMIINKDITKKCQLTQKELKDFEITEFGPQLRWNEKGSKATFLIEFSELELNEIREGLKKINDENKLSVDLVPIYEIFVNK